MGCYSAASHIGPDETTPGLAPGQSLAHNDVAVGTGIVAAPDLSPPSPGGSRWGSSVLQLAIATSSITATRGTSGCTETAVAIPSHQQATDDQHQDDTCPHTRL
jgi:hypothetical protein